MTDFIFMDLVHVASCNQKRSHTPAGTVASVLDFGAFVDIGAEGQGLLHISRISQERVENIYDVLSEGQQVGDMHISSCFTVRDCSSIIRSTY